MKLSKCLVFLRHRDVILVYINLKSILKTTGVLHRRYLASEHIPRISLNSDRIQLARTTRKVDSKMHSNKTILFFL